MTALLVLLAGPLPASPAVLEAHGILRRACARCHDGADAKRAKGGFDSVMDASRMASGGMLSTVLKRIADGSMPPGKKPFPDSDRRAVARWIAQGAKPLIPPRSLIPYADARKLALSDRAASPARERRFLRYLSLGHLSSSDEAAHLRLAVAKLANSLSWHPRLSVPHRPHPSLLRLDLRDYRWSARAWEKLAAADPYREDEDGLVLRADWFVSTASRPPFYHDFLGLPSTDKALERVAGADVAAALSEHRSARAGFNNSGVARSNRVLERIDGTHGAYWRSHDFAEATGRRNIFESPTTFQADGGEIIFHLPNGLQAYLIVDGAGRRLDKAPGEVVQDPSRPDRLVEAGLSCMGCHAGGIIPKDDQVRAHVLGNKAFDKETREAALALYAPSDRWKKLIDEDNARFRRALATIGVPHEADPVIASVLDFERVLDRDRLAAELGVSAAGLSSIIERVPGLARAVAAGKNGTVRREVVEPLWPRLLAERDPSSAPPPALIGHPGLVKSLAALDARSFLSGGADGRVLWWRNGKPRLLAKHPGDVLAVAVSHDGKRFASSSGRDLLVHDAEGKELARLRGHTAPVRAIAFIDANRLVSGGEDRTARVWDITRGETATLSGHKGTVTSIAIGDDGKLVVTGSSDRTARWWDTSTGEEKGRLEAGAEVHAVGWGPKAVAAGTSGGKVVAKPIAGSGGGEDHAGPEGTIRAVRIVPGGIAAASSRGALAWRFGAKAWKSPEAGPATAAAFAPDGTLIAATGDGLRVVPARDGGRR
ncbi:MAG: c-type cytochrome [Gemmataceae bacterium]|nr:c-type cytochrome [Gemmataceae bacterium]